MGLGVSTQFHTPGSTAGVGSPVALWRVIRNRTAEMRRGKKGLPCEAPGWTYTINDCFADTACLPCELMSRLRHSSRACRSVSGYGIILPLASAASFCGGGNVRPGAMQDQSLVTQVDGAWMLFTYNFPAVLDSLLHLHICFPAVLIHTVTTCW